MCLKEKLVHLTKRIAVILGLLAFGEPSFASNGAEVLEGNCKTLNDELVETIFTPEFANKLLLGQLGETVLDRIFEHATTDLSESQKFRIKPVFMEFLFMECSIDPVTLTSRDEEIKQALVQQQETITIRDAISKLQKGLGLDPDQPGWGLVDLPEFDLSTVTCGTLLDDITAAKHVLEKAAENDPEANPRSRRYSWLAPENDVFAIGIRKYKASFEAASFEERAKIDQLGLQLSFLCFSDENRTRTILDMLNEEAETLGVKQ